MSDEKGGNLSRQEMSNLAHMRVTAVSDRPNPPRQKRVGLFGGPIFANVGRRITDIHNAHTFAEWGRLGSLMTAGIGVLGLAGWFLNVPLLAQFHWRSVLIPPRSAVLFAGLGLSLYAYLRNPLRKSIEFLMAGMGGLSFLVALTNGVDYPLLSMGLNGILKRNINQWEYVYRDRMSPLNVPSFLAFGIFLAVLPHLRRLPRIVGDFLGLSACLLLLVHALIMQGFVYGYPLSFPLGFKPTSLPGALATALFAMSFIVAMGNPYFPLRPLSGPSVRAQLLRNFLPVGIGSILLYSLLEHTVFLSTNPAVTATWSAFVATLCVGILVARSSQMLSFQVENAVRDSEKQFEAMVQSAKDHAIFMLDPRGYVITWNRGAEQLKGYTAEEVVGQHFSMFYVPEDRKKGTPTYALAQAKEHGSYQSEGWRLRKDGTPFWAAIALTAVYDKNNHLLGFSKVERDMSENRAVTENLRKTNAMIQMLRTISSAANEASTLEEAMVICLEQVCKEEEWAIGHGLIFDSHQEQLVSADWYLTDPIRFKPFEEAMSSLHFASGVGVPGRVLATGKNVWIPDMGRHFHFKEMKEARAIGLKTVCAFPILCGSEVVGVLEFFSENIVEPAASFLEAMVHVGTQLGLVADRQRVQAQMSTSLMEKEVLLKEIYHRVKNNLQIISSLLRLQSEHVTDPSMIAMLRESQNRVKSMALIHEYLYQSPDLARIDFPNYMSNLISKLSDSFGIDPKDVHFILNIDPIHLGLDTAIPCGLVITELVSNAMKYAFPSKNGGTQEVTVTFKEKPPKHYQLTVKDNGVGLPNDIDIDNASTLGLRLVRALTNQLGGQLNLQRKGGTEFEIAFKES